MPVQLIVSEGVLSADAEKVTFKKTHRSAAQAAWPVWEWVHDP